MNQITTNLKEEPGKTIGSFLIEDVKDFFENRILGWMVSDLKRSIEAGTNFLTALGCLVYTEVIGNFLPPIDSKEKGRIYERCFYRCLFRLKSADDLKRIDMWLRKETNKDIYQQLRHSMTHIYAPMVSAGPKDRRVFIPVMIARDSFVAFTPHIKVKAPPIGFDKKGWMFLATRNYTEELEEAYYSFHKKIFEEEDPSWISSALEGYEVVTKGR